MSKDIWHDCKKQPPLVDDGELVLMDSNDKFWVGFCEITSDGVSYFANNAEPLKNDFVKYARINKLLALETENKDLSDKIGKLETELEKTRKELEQSETCCTEWEKQALDYKAENIALSGELERTRKALETLQEFVTKLYLNGNITDEQLKRYQKMLTSALTKGDDNE